MQSLFCRMGRDNCPSDYIVFLLLPSLMFSCILSDLKIRNVIQGQ